MNETIEFEIKGCGDNQYGFIRTIILLRPSHEFLIRTNILIIELQMNKVSKHQKSNTNNPTYHIIKRWIMIIDIVQILK